MKISMFHLSPHRELPADFEKKYGSIWVDAPWWELADPERVGQYYNWTLDEMVYAAKAGFDGICTNEHHQNAYGFMPNPNVMGGALAKLTNGLDVAIVQMGSTLPTTNPPIRIAEEYAMLDCISGGRLVAGMPLGLAPDVNVNYGVTPLEQRERYREAHDLIIKAWTARELFHWNGKYWQLGTVNIWPRPIQQPHPPVWVPGSGSLSTWEFVTDHDYCYCFLSYFGAKTAANVVDGFWETVTRKGLSRNPFRLGFLQLVGVAETDEAAEREYASHIEYFYHKGLHIPPYWAAVPGHQDYASMANTMRKQQDIIGNFTAVGELSAKELAEREYVMIGSPATVREKLEAAVKRLGVGNLMVVLQFGSMPHEQALKNIDLFSSEVMPGLHDMWEDEWENHWWPKRLLKKQAPTTAAD